MPTQVFHITVAVPIFEPLLNNNYIIQNEENYNFDTHKRFSTYVKPSQPYLCMLVKDDCNNWFYFTSFTVSTLSEVKLARQIFIPEYMKPSHVTSPLQQRLQKENLKPFENGFDKAFAHTALYVDDLQHISSLEQARIAFIDGADDPQIATTLHYIKNTYNSLETRFIAGAETHSFATVTENKYYYENIHIPVVSTLYLQYFIYYVIHDIVPSKQMMPRLLANLWRSQQALRNDWNPNLIQTMNIT